MGSDSNTTTVGSQGDALTALPNAADWDGLRHVTEVRPPMIRCGDVVVAARLACPGPASPCTSHWSSPATAAIAVFPSIRSILIGPIRPIVGCFPGSPSPFADAVDHMAADVCYVGSTPPSPPCA